MQGRRRVAAGRTQKSKRGTQYETADRKYARKRWTGRPQQNAPGKAKQGQANAKRSMLRFREEKQAATNQEKLRGESRGRQATCVQKENHRERSEKERGCVHVEG